MGMFHGKKWLYIVVDIIHPKRNKFAMGVTITATSELKINDSKQSLL